MAQSVALNQTSVIGSQARRAAGLAILLMVGAGMGAALSSYTLPSPAFLLAAGLGMCALLALALTRLDAAVALGFGLLGVVAVEPAPPDVVLLTVIAIAAVTGRFDLSRVPRSVLGVLAVFCTINVLSMVEVIAPAHAALFLSITLYLAVFSVWFATWVNSARRARIVVIAYLFAALTSALLAILALYAPLPGRQALLYDAHRPQALFKDPNVYGPFLIPIALILLNDILQPKILRVRMSLKIAMFVLLSLGVLVSASRAAWLNEILGIFVLLVATAVRRGGGRRALALLVTLLAAGALVVEFAAVTGSDSFIHQRASLQSYDSERFAAQQRGIQLAEQHPFGLGPGQFDVVSTISTHSTYIRVLSEEGILGLVTWIAFALVCLVFALTNVVRGRDTYGISSAALLAAWCGILLNSFVVDTLHWRHLWVVAALIWAGTMRGRTDPQATPASAR